MDAEEAKKKLNIKKQDFVKSKDEGNKAAQKKKAPVPESSSDVRYKDISTFTGFLRRFI